MVFSLFINLTLLNADYSLFCFYFSFLIGMVFIFYLEVLPRTSGEGDQDVKNYLHQPATGVLDFNKDEQLDHRMLQLFGSQISCYQNPYNEYTPPPMSFHFLTPTGNLLFTLIISILYILIMIKFYYFFCGFVVEIDG